MLQFSNAFETFVFSLTQKQICAYFFHTKPWCVRNHMLSVALMFKDHQHKNWLSHMFEWIARRSVFVEQRNRCIGLSATTLAFKAFSKLLSLLFNVLTTCHVPGLPGQCEHSAIIYWIYPLTQHSIDYACVCVHVCVKMWDVCRWIYFHIGCRLKKVHIKFKFLSSGFCFCGPLRFRLSNEQSNPILLFSLISSFSFLLAWLIGLLVFCVWERWIVESWKFACIDFFH